MNKTINEALTSMQKGESPAYEFSMYADYELNRNISDTVSTPANFEYPFLNSTTTLNQSLL